MAITINAIYRDCVFHPEIRPDLPDGAAVSLDVGTKVAVRIVVTPLTGEALLARIRAIAAKANPSDEAETTSQDHDKILYGDPAGPI